MPFHAVCIYVGVDVIPGGLCSGSQTLGVPSNGTREPKV